MSILWMNRRNIFIEVSELQDSTDDDYAVGNIYQQKISISY